MDRNPRYEKLVNSETGEIRQSFNGGGFLHRNPRFYKYDWQIFHRGMPEGRAFFESAPLCTSEAMLLLASLKNKNEGYMVYNSSRPRRGPDVPFNFESERWCEVTTAPPYDEDTDEPWDGRK